MTHLISYFYNAVLEYYPLHQVWCETYQVQRKQIDSHKLCSKCPPRARTQAHKLIGYQSATAPSLATHTADAFAAHQSYDSNVVFTSHVK